jgi:hypothetical protein
MNDIELEPLPQSAEIRTHGEIGPILVVRGQRFTTAKQAKARGGQGK